MSAKIMQQELESYQGVIDQFKKDIKGYNVAAKDYNNAVKSYKSSVDAYNNSFVKDAAGNPVIYQKQAIGGGGMSGAANGSQGWNYIAVNNQGKPIKGFATYTVTPDTTSGGTYGSKVTVTPGKKLPSDVNFMDAGTPNYFALRQGGNAFADKPGDFDRSAPTAPAQPGPGPSFTNAQVARASRGSLAQQERGGLISDTIRGGGVL